MTFELPKLSYAYDALEPIVDSKTMEIHYTKHHQGYVNKLNAALEKVPGVSNKSLEELLKNIEKLPADIQTPVRNNGGGHYNHTLFWSVMTPQKGTEPSENLLKAIKSAFENLEMLREEFSTAAKTRFGSGWAWLSLNKDKKLEVTSTPNQDNPIMHGSNPILGIDVWEHAYYLKYQNRRPEYVDSWWELINWETVSSNFEKTL